MIQRPCHTLLFYMIVVFSNTVNGQHKVNIDWSVYSELPSEVPGTKHSGVAGAYIGVLKNVLIVAGGANFPDKMPWEGGIKKYQTKVYLLPLSDQKTGEWINTTFKFPIPIAYGASIAYQDKLICIGGENEGGPSDKIWEVSLNTGGDIAIKELIHLPIRLTNLSATVVGHHLFIAGGETSDGVSNIFYKLDLNQIDKGFKSLKEIPMAVSHTLLLPSNLKSGAEIYLIGGRKRNANGISTLYSSVLKYNIKKDTWTEQAGLPYPLSALTGVRIANNQFVLLGGDTGETFSKTEHYLVSIRSETDTDKKQELINLKNQLQTNHPGFSKNILHYDVKKNKWTKNGTLPHETPVTTTAVVWNQSIIISSGEIKAGVRSPKIVVGKIK